MGKVRLNTVREITLEPGSYFVFCDVHSMAEDVDGYAVADEHIENLFEFTVEVPEVGTVFLTDSDKEKPDDCCMQLTVNDDDGIGERIELFSKIDRLGPHEKKLIAIQVDRLLLGRKHYGEWTSKDKRDWSREALEEALDMAHYLAALLVK